MSQMLSMGKTLEDGTLVAVIEDWRGGITRHSVKHCDCSHCYPTDLRTWKKFPHVGRFDIEVPPKGNKWKWTHISWRWGKWQYHFTIQKQFLPSWRPFLKERWA